MVRARVWFRCAAMGDPVSPVLVRPAIIGWVAKKRQVDLVIERGFSGAELVRRMKGWITVDPRKAVELLESRGRLKCFDNGELVVEVETKEDLEALQRDISANFGDRCDLEPLG